MNVRKNLSHSPIKTRLKSLANCRYDGHKGYGQTRDQPAGSHDGESSSK